MKLLLFELLFIAVSSQLSPTRTPTPSPSCIPKLYFYDGNGDSLIDTDGSYYIGYLDFDNPGGNGDFEYSSNIGGGQCLYALDTECIKNADGMRWNEIPMSSAYTINYDRHRGCACLSDTITFLNGCADANIDFKTMFLCPAVEGYFGCSPPPNYVPATNAFASFSPTPSRTSSITSSITRTTTPTPSRTSSVTISVSSTRTPTSSITTSPSCIPQYYFADDNGDGLIDTDASFWFGQPILGGSVIDVDTYLDRGDFEDVLSYTMRLRVNTFENCTYPLNVWCEGSFMNNGILQHAVWYEIPYIGITYDRHWGCSCNNDLNMNACIINEINLGISVLCPGKPGYYGCEPPAGYILSSESGFASFTPTSSSTSSSSVSPTSSATSAQSVSPTPSITSASSVSPTSSATSAQSVSPTSSATSAQSVSPTPSITITSSVSPSYNLISASPKQNYTSGDIDNLINNGYDVFPNNTVYFNGTHIGYINPTNIYNAPTANKDLPSSAIIGISSMLGIFGLIALLVLIAVIRKRHKQQPKRTSMMKDASFDRYINDIEGAQVIQSKQGVQLFKSSNNSPIISGIDHATNAHKNDMYYSNPSAEAKKNSIEFIFNPQKHSIFNRLSTTLYQNKMKPHKKAMLPVMTNIKV